MLLLLLLLEFFSVVPSCVYVHVCFVDSPYGVLVRACLPSSCSNACADVATACAPVCVRVCAHTSGSLVVCGVRARVW
uniref:Putative secreted protein n=1 Tax=Anopheles darlingi TaxID=43151 RepID=A0A2M4D1G8_ANODA